MPIAGTFSCGCPADSQSWVGSVFGLTCWKESHLHRDIPVTVELDVRYGRVPTESEYLTDPGRYNEEMKPWECMDLWEDPEDQALRSVQIFQVEPGVWSFSG